jgi:hypothetical protein
VSMSNYLENEVLDHILRGTSGAWTAPTALYLSLHTSDPGEAYTSGEVSGGSYVRQVVMFSAAASGASALSPTASGAYPGSYVEFTGMPAATVTHLGIWDASTSGNLLCSGALTASRAVSAGDSLRVTSLTVTLD